MYYCRLCIATAMYCYCYVLLLLCIATAMYCFSLELPFSIRFLKHSTAKKGIIGSEPDIWECTGVCRILATQTAYMLVCTCSSIVVLWLEWVDP